MQIGSAGALEHSYSSLFVFPAMDRLSLDFEGYIAHEFMHILTPLNLHGDVIQPFNFEVPTASQHIWLYEGVSNSGNGTISRVRMDGSIQTVLTGYSNSGGPYGLSFDRAGRMYFLDHATGGVYSYDFKRAPQLLATATGWGGTFTGIGFSNRLFFTDVNPGYLLTVADGATTVFASGFAAKSGPPYIGPNGVAYDGRSKLYVADADSIYVITRVK